MRTKLNSTTLNTRWMRGQTEKSVAAIPEWPKLTQHVPRADPHHDARFGTGAALACKHAASALREGGTLGAHMTTRLQTCR
eukprot:CAMPEP_0203858892 /NCGR_PEP_ID=MMETSP0359-20131031/11531_1 /ASSEMBLY_ACC=CAM_ASM_000338 /TAXON_ID=268821 /ORGANISM="Scrippsiella Hangoei, Strain SHTV-5" /LENGTH=80 /DNA_ID=CAMNT_0050775721 /DNA_START=201 /DNA_END=443 /DNA_ORIENTATION=-